MASSLHMEQDCSVVAYPVELIYVWVTLMVRLSSRMHLYLIRHAQSINNELYARTGSDDGRHPDPPLTDVGRRQAQLLAQFLAGPTDSADAVEKELLYGYAARHNRTGFALTHLYCSLMIRAIETGNYVSAATGLPLVAWQEVHERGGLHLVDEASGEDIGLPGPNHDWLSAAYPNLVLPDGLGDAGWWNQPRENIEDAIVRARAAITQLLDRHGDTDDHVAVITHGGFFQSLLEVLLTGGELASQLANGRQIWFGMSNASISRFEINDGYLGVRYLNRVDFLPNELITG
ncbi:MAG TPA: histidine phosphatase family protein [Promineifilum sp.]